MRNNFFKLSIAIFFMLHCNFSFSDDLIFDTQTINISNNGDLTIAENGKAIFPKENLEINGKIFEYDNLEKILTVTSADSFVLNDNVRIKSNKILYNRNDFTLLATGNVELVNLEDNSKIFTEELIFNNKLKKIISKKKS